MTFGPASKRQSGLPSPSAGILGSNRKSKLRTPQNRRTSRLTTYLTPKKCESVQRGISTSSLGRSGGASTSRLARGSSVDSLAATNSTLEPLKSSLDAPTCLSPEQKNTPTRRLLSNVSSETSKQASALDEDEAVKVGVRIRPLFGGDHDTRAFVLGPENTIIKNANGSDNAAYQFKHVYGESSTTQQLYDDMVSDIVKSVVLEGRNGTVFTYGQTSTGKTHTMHGILMSAGEDLFGLTKNDSQCNEHVRLSCMELYNEELRDLLCPSTASLYIQEDRNKNVIIANLSERIINSLGELMDAIRTAEENRTVGSTSMNEQSSRSHTIFRVTYEKKEAANVGTSVAAQESEDKENSSAADKRMVSQRSRQKTISSISTLNLVDLAGSESVRVTGAKGERQKEGGKINQSLLTLSRVLTKLAKKDRGHINYRDSKLTRILKPSLSGNARMGCICCITPALQYSEESKSTLDFATRTMLVTTNAKSNQMVEYDDALVEELETEIERVKMEASKAEESRKQMEQSLNDADDQIVCLRASIGLEKSKVTSLEKQANNQSTQMEELKAVHEENVHNLMKEIGDLKNRNQVLKANVAECEIEKKRLMEQREPDDRALKRLKSEQSELVEKHRGELRELRGELASAQADNQSSQEEIAILKSDMASLNEKNLKLESNLMRELEKAQRRKDEAKERRQKFKGKLVGMTETLREDMVQLSYQK